MKIGIKVGDVMTREFISVKPETSLQDCMKIMIKKRVGSLVVKEDEKLKGLITERDILWALTKKSKADLKKIKADEVARRKIITIKPSADLYDAMQKMRKSNYRWLPVTINSKVIGLLTLKDILKIEPALFDIVKAHDVFDIREEKEKLKRRDLREGNRSWLREGMCEECGDLNLLYKINGVLVCEDCRENI